MFALQRLPRAVKLNRQAKNFLQNLSMIDNFKIEETQLTLKNKKRM